VQVVDRIHGSQNSRQRSVVLHLVLQRGKALNDSLALLGLLAILFSRDGLMHIIDGSGLEQII
jgi:hypothetical protein